MPPLPPAPTPTIDAIYRSYEARQGNGYRVHLGGSVIGAPCERSIWYSWRWTTPAVFDGRMLRLFDTGNLAEARFIADLRRAGVTVLDVNPDTGRQWEVRDESGHFGGSMDAVAQGLLEAPKTWHVCEFKTHSEKSFTALKNKGVRESKPQHFAQMQVYMHLASMERAFYLAVNKNTDELYAERVHYEAEYALRLIAKAHRIIKATEPPERISQDPSWFQCRFCDHAGLCHGSKEHGTQSPETTMRFMPERHCRSCMFSTPVDNGKWHCERHDFELDPATQRTGCVTHRYIPSIVPADQIDTHPNGDWIEYQFHDGSTWTDGEKI